MKKNFNNSHNFQRIFPNLVKNISKYEKKFKNLISHNVFFFKNKKIITTNLLSSNIILIAICSKITKSKMIFFFFFNVLIAFINYIKMHNINNTYNIHTIVFESIFLLPLQKHFALAAKEIFRRHTLFLNNINYKGSYLVDLWSNKIILSLESLFDLNSTGAVEMKIPNKEIWKEILFHSHKLRNDYIKKFNFTFHIENLQNFFTNLTFKSTYPRLIYIIKFLPLLGGMVLINEFVQNKMSNYDGEKRAEYQEFEYNSGYYLDEHGNIITNDNYEILLDEPDVLTHIHFFIIECLFCNSDKFQCFSFNKQEKIYFSEAIIKLINKQIYSNIQIEQFTKICSNQKAVHELFKKIINSLYEEYILIKAKEKKSKESAMIQKKDTIDNSLNKSFYLSYPNSLYISKRFTLNTIFNSGQLSDYMNPNDISLNLSSDEDTEETENIFKWLREKNQFTQNNDPYFYNRYHYAKASKESTELMDLMRDNYSDNIKQLIPKYYLKNKNKNENTNKDYSVNINTDLSSKNNFNINNTLYLKPNFINNNNYYNNFNPLQENYSMNSSQIMNLMQTKDNNWI